MTEFSRFSERIARATTRRQFAHRASAAVFGATAAVAAGGVRPSVVFANHLRSDTPCPDSSKGCKCVPRYDGKYQYCTSYSSDLCDGGKCNTKKCRYNLEDWTSTGCWCTKVCCHGSTRGYYHCCDCSCPTPNDGQRLCGCRAFRMTCPKSGSAAEGSGSGEIEIAIIGEADPADALSQLYPGGIGGPPCC